MTNLLAYLCGLLTCPVIAIFYFAWQERQLAKLIEHRNKRRGKPMPDYLDR